MPTEPDTNEGTPCGMADCCRLTGDPVCDDLIRRALEIRNPVLVKEFLPFTLTPEQMRAQADRRAALGIPDPGWPV